MPNQQQKKKVKVSDKSKNIEKQTITHKKPHYNTNEVFYLQNKDTMTNVEMDKELGLTNRMRKVANNLRKFGQIEGEKSNTREYHREMAKDGLKKIQKEGIRNYCDRVGEKFGVSGSTIKSDYSIMKRYGMIE